MFIFKITWWFVDYFDTLYPPRGAFSEFSQLRSETSGTYWDRNKLAVMFWTLFSKCFVIWCKFPKWLNWKQIIFDVSETDDVPSYWLILASKTWTIKLWFLYIRMWFGLWHDCFASLYYGCSFYSWIPFSKWNIQFKTNIKGNVENNQTQI